MSKENSCQIIIGKKLQRKKKRTAKPVGTPQTHSRSVSLTSIVYYFKYIYTVIVALRSIYKNSTILRNIFAVYKTV